MSEESVVIELTDVLLEVKNENVWIWFEGTNKNYKFYESERMG